MISVWVQTEDVVVEHIDLIREAKELPHSDRSKIGNRQPVTTTSTSTVDDDESESNSDYSEGFAEERPTYTKLEEIDLLSSIGRDIGVDLEKYAQPVPDVVAMESIESMRQPRSTSIIKDHMDTNKLLDRQLPEASSADARKKEKMVKNQAKRRQQQQQQQQQQQSRNSNSQRRLDKRRVDIDNGSGKYLNVSF